MTNDPVKSTDQASRSSSGLSRRAALKRAAGAGIIMSSFSSGSALAAVSCKKFSNWMSGSGSPRLVDEELCTQGESPDFWKEVDAGGGTCSTEYTYGSCEAVLDILESEFNQVFTGGSLGTFQEILDGAGASVERAFAAAYLNAFVIVGYPLTTTDLADLWSKLNDPGFSSGDIEAYLESTYVD